MNSNTNQRIGGVVWRSWWSILLCLGAATGLRADPPIEGHFRRLTGVARFTNVNPAILSRLDAPGNEGVTSLAVRAYSVAPNEGLFAQVYPAAPGRLGSAYELVVQAGESAATAIGYDVDASFGLLGDRYLYYPRSRRVASLVQGPEPVGLNLEECVGLLRLRFVDETGAPVAVEGGSGFLYDDTLVLRGQLLSVAAGTTELHLAAPTDGAFTLTLQVQRGADAYRDQIVYAVRLENRLGCDEMVLVPVVLTSPAALGRISGEVDMGGEFEWTTEASPWAGLKGRTAVIASGPSGNRRLGFIAGDNVAIPASGRVELENLVPSDSVTPAEPWRIQAEMHFRKNRRFEYFISPALGQGANPGLLVSGGGTTELGNRFLLQPGEIRGKLVLAGPPDTAAVKSALRGLARPDYQGLDEFGIPKGSGYSGIANSHLLARGQDTAAPGAAYTAAGGRAAVSFEGSLSGDRGIFAGDYEVAVAGLAGEASVWRVDEFHLVLAPVAEPGVSHVNQSLVITDRSAPSLTVAPGGAQEHHLSLGLSEVQLRLRSRGRRVHSPTVIQSTGSFVGLDFEGRPRDYAVLIEGAHGLPAGAEMAAEDAVVTLYLPQGDYELKPAAQVIGDDGSGSFVQFDTLVLRVGARQRIGVEACLRAVVQFPECTADGAARVKGLVSTCGQGVSRVSYQLDDEAPVTVCVECGSAPALDFLVPVTPGPHALTVIATDTGGASSTVTGVIGSGLDTQGPVLFVPDRLVLPGRSPCGARAEYDGVTASDACSVPTLTYDPPAGTLLPPGEHPATVTATDASGQVMAARTVLVVNGPAAGEVLPVPQVLAVFPTGLPPGGGVPMVFRGLNFTPDDTFTLGGNPVSNLVFVNSTEVNGVAPAWTGENRDVAVLRCGVVAGTLPAIIAPLETLSTLVSVTPGFSFAAGGGPVTVRGTGFTANTRVRFGFPAVGDGNLLRNTTVSEDGTQLNGEIPPLPPGVDFGWRDVQVEDAAGTATLVAAFEYGPDPGGEDRQVKALRRLEGESTEPLSVGFRRGMPTSVGLRVKVAGATPEARARTFLETHRELFRQPAGAALADLALVSEDVGALTHVRLEQLIGGVPVMAGEVVVGMEGDEVFSVQGALLPAAEVANRGIRLVPTLTADDALQRGRLALGVALPLAALDSSVALVLFDFALLNDVPMDPHLAFHVTFPTLDRELFLDAHNGAVLFQRRLSKEVLADLNGLNLEVYDGSGRTNHFTDKCAVLGAILLIARGSVVPNPAGGFIDASTFNANYRNDTVAMNLNQHARDAFEFFSREFGWRALNGNSSVLRFFAHDPVSNNASFGGGCRAGFFGDPFVDFEVVVHELGHGIIDTAGNSNLEYAFQSGALNESYVDLMAVGASRQRGQNDWLLGVGSGTSPLPIRDIENPNRSRSFSQPLHFGDFRVFMPDTNGVVFDAGGVHINSGIPNRAGFLMSEGMNLPSPLGLGQPMPGIGLRKMLLLKFLAMRNLPRNADFTAARNYEVRLAEVYALARLSGFVREDAAAVRNAWYLVGVGYPDLDRNGFEETNDADRDFVPDHVDNCPRLANPLQIDGDGDGWGDGCDNCPRVANRDQKDTDSDKVGDVCDPDLDGDGCSNAFDLRPKDKMRVVGQIVAVGLPAGCVATSGALMESEEVPIDTDRDGKFDCEDADDDGDGIPDDGISIAGGLALLVPDVCPVGNLKVFYDRSGLQRPILVLVEECGAKSLCVPSKQTLPGKNLPFEWNKFFVRVRDAVVNPPIENVVILRNVQVINERVFVRPAADQPLAGVVSAVAGIGRVGGRALAGSPAPAMRRLELWEAATRTSPARLVSVLNDFDPNRLLVGSLDQGEALVFTPALEDQPARFDAVWQFGSSPAALAADSDRDGIPDGYELNHGLSPRTASDALGDADGDGVDNLTEFRRGTDPQRDTGTPVGEASVRIVDVARAGSGLRLRIEATPGRTVRVERTPSLAPGAWQAVGDAVRVPAGLTSVEVELGTEGRSESFFRARLEP